MAVAPNEIVLQPSPHSTEGGPHHQVAPYLIDLGLVDDPQEIKPILDQNPLGAEEHGLLEHLKTAIVGTDEIVSSGQEQRGFIATLRDRVSQQLARLKGEGP